MVKGMKIEFDEDLEQSEMALARDSKEEEREIQEEITILAYKRCNKRIKTNLPLILILSVYTDFLPVKFGKIQIFFLKIWQNTDFFEECVRIFFIFSLVLQVFSLNY